MECVVSESSPPVVRNENEGSWRASWYDLRAFFGAWLALRRNPALSDQGGAALGFTPMAFARFGLILLPAAIVAAAGLIFNLLGRPPDETVVELSERVGALRERLQAVPATPSPADAASGYEQVLADYNKATRRARLTFHGVEPDPAVLDQSEQAVIAAYTEHLPRLAAADQARFIAHIDAEWAQEQRVMRWLARWSASGANDFFGALISGLVLIVCSRLFRWWVRRKAAVYPSAERASDYFLYLVTQRVLIGWGIAIFGMLALQAGSGFQLPWAISGGMVLLLVGTLVQVWGFWSAGKPIAALLVGAAPSAAQRRGIGLRLLLMWLLQQIMAAVFVGLLMLLFRVLA